MFYKPKYQNGKDRIPVFDQIKSESKAAASKVGKAAIGTDTEIARLNAEIEAKARLQLEYEEQQRRKAGQEAKVAETVGIAEKAAPVQEKVAEAVVEKTADTSQPPTFGGSFDYAFTKARQHFKDTGGIGQFVWNGGLYGSAMNTPEELQKYNEMFKTSYKPNFAGSYGNATGGTRVNAGGYEVPANQTHPREMGTSYGSAGKVVDVSVNGQKKWYEPDKNGVGYWQNDRTGEYGTWRYKPNSKEWTEEILGRDKPTQQMSAKATDSWYDRTVKNVQENGQTKDKSAGYATYQAIYDQLPEEARAKLVREAGDEQAAVELLGAKYAPTVKKRGTGWDRTILDVTSSILGGAVGVAAAVGTGQVWAAPYAAYAGAVGGREGANALYDYATGETDTRSGYEQAFDALVDAVPGGKFLSGSKHVLGKGVKTGLDVASGKSLTNYVTGKTFGAAIDETLDTSLEKATKGQFFNTTHYKNEGAKVFNDIVESTLHPRGQQLFKQSYLNKLAQYTLPIQTVREISKTLVAEANDPAFVRLSQENPSKAAALIEQRMEELAKQAKPQTSKGVPKEPDIAPERRRRGDYAKGGRIGTTAELNSLGIYDK
jgi:hypothetical protein